MELTADSIYEQLMEHGRHVERERAWLLNFYIAVLAGFIYGLLEGRFTEETLRLASLTLAVFSLVALIATIKLDAEYANILRMIESRFGPGLKPVSRVWYRPLFSVGAWTSAFYGAMLALFLMLFFSGMVPKLLDSLPLLACSGAVTFCFRHVITEHVRRKTLKNRVFRVLRPSIPVWIIWLAFLILYLIPLAIWSLTFIIHVIYCVIHKIYWIEAWFILVTLAMIIVIWCVYREDDSRA